MSSRHNDSRRTAQWSPIVNDESPLVGDQVASTPRGGRPLVVNCALYSESRYVRDIEDIDEAPATCREHPDNAAFVWIGIVEPTVDEFASLARQFQLPRAAVEDALTAHERPKYEVHGDVAVAVTKPLRYFDDSEDIEVSDVSVLYGPNFVITVRNGPTAIPSMVRHELNTGGEHQPTAPLTVLYRVLDMIVDDYLTVSRAIDDDITDIEREVFSESTASHIPRIYLLKREVIEFRRAAVPLVDVLRDMRRHRWRMDDEMKAHFRDVHDHLLRVTEALESYDQLLTSALQSVLAMETMRENQVALQQNVDQRKMSAWAAIFLFPTLVTSFFGMNFSNIPLLDTTYGVWVALGLMVLSAVGLFVNFKRMKWL